MAFERVTIIPSTELAAWRLRRLIGRTGTVVEFHPKGAFVKLDKPYLEEDEWLIPRASLQHNKEL